MTTKILLTMPQPGETITQGTIVRWLIEPGTKVKEGDFVVELETEKALFEYESPYEGKLLEYVGQPGQTIKVGNPIAVFEVEDAKASTYFMLGIGQKTEDKISELKSKPQKETKVFKLSPYVRRLIKENHIDLNELSLMTATGPNQRITKEDVLGYLKTRSQTSSAKKIKTDFKESDTETEYLPCSPVRIRIAENMLKSKQTIPHAHTNVSVDITRLVEFRLRIKDDFLKKQGHPLTMMTLIFESLKKSVLDNPLVNASFIEKADRKFIAQHKKINLGIAVGTNKGLFIPVLHHVEKMNAIEFSKEQAALIERAQNGKLTLDDLTGVTFTFNNFGYFGTSIGVQIILPPQSATLGMGRIDKRPWVVGDVIKVRMVAEFTLAFDHRVLDGREAGLFLNQVKELIENFDEDQFQY